jgi:hypothetical protein
MPLSNTLHAAVTLGALLAGCGPTGGDMMNNNMVSNTTCGADTRGQTYLPGMAQTGMDHLLTVKLMSSDPGPPIKGNNNWVIQVNDAMSAAAVDGLNINAVPFMPDHGHGTPIKVAITPMGSGTYGLAPVNLFMAGLWQITINMTSADMKTSDLVVFSFCVEG